MNIENCLENLNEEASYAMIQLLATSNSEETLDELVDYLVDKFESADDLAEFDRYELTIKDKGEEIYNSYEVWPTILENPNISTTSMLKIIDTFGDVFSQYDIGFRSNMDIEVAEKILQLSTDFYTIGTLVKMYLFSQHVYDTLIERFKNKELTLFINEYAHSTDLSRNFDLDLEYILTGYSVGLRLDFLIWWEQNRNHFIVSSYRPGDDSLHYVVKMLRVVFKPMNPTKTYDLYEEDADMLATKVMNNYTRKSEAAIYAYNRINPDSDINWIASKCSPEKKEALLTWWKSEGTVSSSYTNKEVDFDKMSLAEASNRFAALVSSNSSSSLDRLVDYVIKTHRFLNDPSWVMLTANPCLSKSSILKIFDEFGYDTSSTHIGALFKRTDLDNEVVSKIIHSIENLTFILIITAKNAVSRDTADYAAFKIMTSDFAKRIAEFRNYVIDDEGSDGENYIDIIDSLILEIGKKCSANVKEQVRVWWKDTYIHVAIEFLHTVEYLVSYFESSNIEITEDAANHIALEVMNYSIELGYTYGDPLGTCRGDLGWIADRCTPPLGKTLLSWYDGDIYDE